MKIRKIVVGWLRVFLAATAFFSPASNASEVDFENTKASLKVIAEDMCDRELVLLGENGFHGDGGTISIKVELTKWLITRCGFDAVFFEARVRTH